MLIGPSFPEELRRAGLLGLPFAWGDDGQICGRDNLTAEQNAALDAVLAAHDPSRQPTPASVKMWQAKSALANAGKLEAANAAVTRVGGAIAIAWEYAPDVSRNSPAVAAMAQAIGLTDADVDALFAAAAGIQV